MSEVVPQPLFPNTLPLVDWRTRPAAPGVDPRIGAFAAEEAEVPAEGRGPEVLTGADATEALEMLLDRTRRGPTVAEVHVPFCETKCAGCSCWQNEYRQLESSRYADAVVKEMAVWSDTHAQSGAPVQALRVGGGNPTALEAVDILRILSSARRLLPLANDCEVVLEARVHHFTEEKMEAALAGGVTRFELPVRSFNTAVRRAVGRVEEGFEAARLLERLARYDEAGVAAELNYGLPGQSLDVWETDLRTASSLPLDGLTLRAAGEPDFPGARVKTERAAGPAAFLPTKAGTGARPFAGGAPSATGASSKRSRSATPTVSSLGRAPKDGFSGGPTASKERSKTGSPPSGRDAGPSLRSPAPNPHGAPRRSSCAGSSKGASPSRPWSGAPGSSSRPCSSPSSPTGAPRGSSPEARTGSA